MEYLAQIIGSIILTTVTLYLILDIGRTVLQEVRQWIIFPIQDSVTYISNRREFGKSIAELEWRIEKDSRRLLYEYQGGLFGR